MLLAFGAVSVGLWVMRKRARRQTYGTEMKTDMLNQSFDLERDTSAGIPSDLHDDLRDDGDDIVLMRR